MTCKRRMVYDYHQKLQVEHGDRVYLWVADPKGLAFVSIKGKRELGDWRELAIGVYRHEDRRVRYANDQERQRHTIMGWR